MSTSNAEAIAKVIADLRAGRVRPVDVKGRMLTATDGTLIPGIEAARLAHSLVRGRDPVVIDATAIRQSIPDGVPVDLYGDHPCIAPPFEEMAVSFVNAYGNVLVLHVLVADTSISDRWDTADPIDWDRVRWRLTAHLYVGGRSDTEDRDLATLGPAYLWRIAVYDDGEMADLSWADLSPSYSATGADFTMEMLTLLRTLNFLNASNVDVAEPARPRAERRRIERAGGGVVVKTIHVYPPGPRRAGSKGTPLGEGTGEFSPTRGHFAHYGEKYNRGLLFGKYEGKFWHPARVRVKGDRPDVDYEVHG